MSAAGGQSAQLGYWNGYDLATRRGTQRATSLSCSALDMPGTRSKLFNIQSTTAENLEQLDRDVAQDAAPRL